MIGGFSYHGEAWRLPQRLAYHAEGLADAELNRFLDEVLPRFGSRLWAHEGHNLVTDQGAQWLCGRFPSTATASSWFVLFKGAGAVSAANTAASHPAWSEIHTVYSQPSRPALTMPTPTTGRTTDNTASLASVSITAATTIHGFGLINNSTKGLASGILYGVGDYGSPRALISGDIYRAQASVTF